MIGILPLRLLSQYRCLQQEGLHWAVLAARFRLEAMAFANTHNQPVHLIVDLNQSGAFGGTYW
jgi:hypothetical protein